MIKYSQDHQADVFRLLGVEPPDPSVYNMGMEIEVSWRSQQNQCDFLEALDRGDLKKQLVCLYDGSTKNPTVSTEIVTLPMKPHQLKALVTKVGAVLQEYATKGLVTEKCGTHIHVSHAPFTNEQKWRAICAVHQQATSDSIVAHAFWDAISLRRQSAYCNRSRYSNLWGVGTRHNAGPTAVIAGYNKPTLEFRLFRTPRSTRILLSYIDIVEALLDFSKAAPAELLHSLPSAGWAKTAPWPGTPQAQLSAMRNFDNNTMMWYDGNTGTYYKGDKDITRLEVGGYSIVVPKVVPKGYFLPPVSFYLEGWNALKDCLQDWKGKTFPVQAFAEFVLDKKRLYPDLATRLGYDKFKPFVTGNSAAVSSGWKTYESARTDPHLEFAVGCFVHHEDAPNAAGYYISRIPRDPLVEGMGLEDAYSGTYLTVSLDNLIHSCPGALEKGGEC